MRFTFPCLALLLLWSSVSWAGTVPRIGAAVTDNAGVLSRAEQERLSKKLVALRERTGAQIAILTIKSTHGEPIEDYSMAVVERWQGGSEARDDGVLLVLAVRDRRTRLEVGYGLEDRLTDSRSRQILDGMVPDLRNGDYFRGLNEAVDDIGTALDGLDPYPAPPIFLLFASGALVGLAGGFGQRAVVSAQNRGKHRRFGGYGLVLLGVLLAGVIATSWVWATWPYYASPACAFAFPAMALYLSVRSRELAFTLFASVAAVVTVAALPWLEQGGASTLVYVVLAIGTLMVGFVASGVLSSAAPRATAAVDSWTWPADKDPGITPDQRAAPVDNDWGSAPEYHSASGLPSFGWRSGKGSGSGWGGGSSGGSSSGSSGGSGSGSSGGSWGGGGGGFGGGGASGSW